MQSTPAHTLHNEDLLAIIPKGCKRVVEVGCSNGVLAKAYLEQNPDCEYLGIEISEEYATLAREHIRVRVGDIETFTEEDFRQFGKVDCWVFGDVLEHLIDPWEVLAKLARASDLETRIALCIPNMQHWTVLRALISGDLFYQRTGLLDVTHLRWFTGKTLVASLEHTGWTVLQGKARLFQEPGPEREDFIAKLGVFAGAVGMDKESVMNHALVYQFVVLAKPTKEICNVVLSDV